MQNHGVKFILHRVQNTNEIIPSQDFNTYLPILDY